MRNGKGVLEHILQEESTIKPTRSQTTKLVEALSQATQDLLAEDSAIDQKQANKQSKMNNCKNLRPRDDITGQWKRRRGDSGAVTDE